MATQQQKDKAEEAAYSFAKKCAAKCKADGIYQITHVTEGSLFVVIGSAILHNAVVTEGQPAEQVTSLQYMALEFNNRSELLTIREEVLKTFPAAMLDKGNNK